MQRYMHVCMMNLDASCVMLSGCRCRSECNSVGVGGKYVIRVDGVDVFWVGWKSVF